MFGKLPLQRMRSDSQALKTNTRAVCAAHALLGCKGGDDLFEAGIVAER
jgi:hypothetical protein